MNNSEIKTEKLINNIKTSMEMENQFLSEQDINVLSNFANNKISYEKHLQYLRRCHFK